MHTEDIKSNIQNYSGSDTELLQYINADGSIKDNAPLSIKILHASIILKMCDYVDTVMLNYLCNTRVIDLSASDLTRIIRQSLDKYFNNNAAANIYEFAEKKEVDAKNMIKILEGTDNSGRQ